MSNMINVDGSDDPSYRYKMPRLVSKVEGRGNGVKTVLVNCTDVAGALHRSSAQVTKFFGCELGAMTKYEEKIDRALVNGAFDNQILQEALTGYIQKFVLCPSCGNPETVQELKGKKKSAMIYLNCKACGACEEADNTHKLVTFIVKEMGPGEGGNKKALRKKKREERNKTKKANSASGGEDASVSDGEKKLKKKKKKKDKKDKSGKEKKKKKHKDKSSKKKIQADSREEKEEHANKEVDIEDDASSSDSEVGSGQAVEDVADDLGFMTVHDVAAMNSAVERITANLVKPDISDEEILKQIEELQVNSGLRRADRIPISFFSTYNSKIPLAVLMQKLKLLEPVINAVKDCYLEPLDIEIELLLCLEEAVVRADEGDDRTSVRKMFPVVLKLLYDEDFVEEKTILDWYAGTLDVDKYKHLRCLVAEEEVKLMKEAAKPIIEWLNEAESDSESDDE